MKTVRQAWYGMLSWMIRPVVRYLHLGPLVERNLVEKHGATPKQAATTVQRFLHKGKRRRDG